MKTLQNIPVVSLTIILAIFLLALAIGRDLASAQVNNAEELSAQLDIMLRGSNFRGTVLVARGEEVILRAAYGMACDERGIPNAVYSPFHIASVTKNFTAAAILLLQAEGLLDVSYTLDNFFVGGDGLENVTVAHLLAMQGGFYDYSEWVFRNPLISDMQEALGMTPCELEAYILENFWSGAPRCYSAYCNTDYWLLGRIVEHVSGMPYEDFVADRLFAPVGMTNSGFSGMDESVAPHGLPRLYMDGKNLVDPSNWPFFFAYSTGGLISTIDDLNLWLDAYFGGALFPMYMIDDIRVGVYNYGWVFADEAIWHHSGGGMPGFSSIIIYDQTSSTRIILLSNSWTGVNRNLVRAVTDAVLGVPVDGFALPSA